MSVLKLIPPTMLTLFADLAQRVRQAPVAGSVYERQRDGITYIYAKIPVGTARIDSFIGKTLDPGAQEQAKLLRKGMKLRAENRKTVSLLKSAGFAPIRSQIGAILDTLSHSGLFDNGAVLVGTAAYTVSEAHVGAFLPEPTLMTGDVDLAAADLALTADPSESMIDILRRADPSFEPVMQIDPRQSASRFRSERAFYVDLVTPTQRRSDRNPMPLDSLQAGAAPLQQLEWLIESPVPTIAVHDQGIAVNIPQPARLAVHKLLLAQCRPPDDRIKRDKDLRQADALMTALYANDPFALDDCIDDARRHGKKGWSDRIDRSLAEIERRRSS